VGDFSYQMLALVHIVALREKFEIVQPPELLNKISAAAQAGTVLVTFCCSTADLLAPISAVFSAGYISQEFRLVILVHNLALQVLTDYSKLFDRCEMVSIDAPITIKVAMTSSISSLKSPTFNPFVPKLALFDAAFSVFNRMSLFAPLTSFFNFHVASQCAADVSLSNMPEIQKFITHVVYESQWVRLWDRVSGASIQEYSLPKSSNEKVIENALSKFPDADDPTLFGLSPKSLRLFKSRLMSIEREEGESSIDVDLEQVETIPVLRTELFLIKLSLSLGRQVPFVDRRLTQILTSPDTIDVGLLIAPDVFIEMVKYFALMKGDQPGIHYVVVLEGKPGKSIEAGSFVTGLMCQGSHFQSGVFTKFDGCKALPPMWIHAVENSEIYTPANFYYNGRVVTTLFVRTAEPDLEVYILPCVLDINS
jgi:hypothetical protein